ncbi:hypothetical protein [Pedobacter agri]|uniref:hypothetical protein n=1 Tax=Pedobacter agri TaxID=454586 RepID=UPI00292E37B9|nr:hypothetical protein [Pedobacter agri]
MITLSENLTQQLNEHETMFVSMAMERFHQLVAKLNAGDLSSEYRLFYIKELYSIFAEIDNIPFIKKYKSDPPPPKDVIEIIKGLDQTVKFVRNVLLHFPLFNTWDEIWISKAFAKAMIESPIKDRKNKPKGEIFKYLDNEFQVEGKAFKFIDPESKEEKLCLIKRPLDVDMDEKIFLKDILSEDEGAFTLLSLKLHTY